MMTTEELLRQTEQVLLPASRNDIAAALERLPLYRVLAGYRGKPGCNMPALVDAIARIAAWAIAEAVIVVGSIVGGLVGFAVGRELVRAGRLRVET